MTLSYFNRRLWLLRGRYGALAIVLMAVVNVALSAVGHPRLGASLFWPVWLIVPCGLYKVRGLNTWWFIVVRQLFGLAAWMLCLNLF